jgi:hypothetical protein
VRTAFFALALAAGCSGVSGPRKYLDGWQISSTAYPPIRRLIRSGHLLVQGPGSVLLLGYLEAGFPMEVDGSVCHDVRISLPRPLRPGVFRDPLAYDHVYGCILGPYAEERLVRGRVSVFRADARTVVADLDLEFPRLRLRGTETFTVSTPDEDDTAPPLKSPNAGAGGGY